MKKILILLSIAVLNLSRITEAKQPQYEICIYGGTSAGVIAAYSAKKLGKSVVLIVPDNHIGGLSTGGLGQTDIGNKIAVTGLARDFYRRLGSYYGRLEAWQFEPKAASRIFNDYIAEAKIPIIYNKRLQSVTKEGGWIKSVTLEDSKNPDNFPPQLVSARMFIDCTYEGDLMALAGVSYTVGRESNAMYSETHNGVQLMDNHHQFPGEFDPYKKPGEPSGGIDPYKKPGDPSSGLLWGISNETLAPVGSGDKKVQAYNFRICLTNKPDNLIPVTRPDNYDSTRYELLLRLMKHTGKSTLSDYFIWGIMPNQKTDINNMKGFSTDMIGMNWDYPDASYAEREKIIASHVGYTKGLLYFVGHDLRVPEELRRQMLQWGYPKDEYTQTGNFSPQLYIREARRMIGEYVMTEHNCTAEEVVSDAVGMAAYGMDSHNVQRIVADGMVINEGDVGIGPIPPYPVSYRSIIPKRGECKNLLVPVCLSASHIAYGSIRMEPVFMVLAQSSAVAASDAINTNKTVQEVDVKKIQAKLTEDPLLDGSIPDIIIDDSDSAFIQKAGTFGKRTNGRQYGVTYLVSDKADDKTILKYVPAIKETAHYDAYFYCPANTRGGKIKIQVIVKDKTFTVELDPAQYPGEFAPFGTFSFKKGQTPSISVMSANGKGPLVADALLLKAKK